VADMSLHLYSKMRNRSSQITMEGPVHLTLDEAAWLNFSFTYVCVIICVMVLSVVQSV
jgi:hypothetical protein